MPTPKAFRQVPPTRTEQDWAMGFNRVEHFGEAGARFSGLSILAGALSDGA